VNILESEIMEIYVGRADEKLYEKAKQMKEKMRVYVWFEELGYLEIVLDTEILAVLQFS
jgi:hypothetical protein